MRSTGSYPAYGPSSSDSLSFLDWKNFIVFHRLRGFNLSSKFTTVKIFPFLYKWSHLLTPSYQSPLMVYQGDTDVHPCSPLIRHHPLLRPFRPNLVQHFLKYTNLNLTGGVGWEE